MALTGGKPIQVHSGLGTALRIPPPGRPPNKPLHQATPSASSSRFSKPPVTDKIELTKNEK